MSSQVQPSRRMSVEVPLTSSPPGTVSTWVRPLARVTGNQLRVGVDGDRGIQRGVDVAGLTDVDARSHRADLGQTEHAVGVDQAGIDVLAGGVDHRCAGQGFEPGADLDDAPLGKRHGAVRDRLADHGVHGGADDRHRAASRGEAVEVDQGFRGGRRRRVAARLRRRRSPRPQPCRRGSRRSARLAAASTAARPARSASRSNSRTPSTQVFSAIE